MNSELKRSIQSAFDAPIPDMNKKERFLRNLPQPKISIQEFIFSQIAYMRKGTMLFSALLLVPALIGAAQINKNTLWVISSIVPFLGLLAVSESTRSIEYGMCEFEMSTRFSLKSVVLAKMSFLGLMDFMILCALAFLCRIGNELFLLQTGIYLFVPYLLTVNLCLWITRCFHGKENIFGCMSICVLISGVNGGLHYFRAPIYDSIFLIPWVILAVLLLADTVYEICCTVKQTEELVWS